MIFTRIRLAKDVTNRLKAMNSRAGLDANIICRLGLCFSLEDSKIANQKDWDEEGMEINRYTLLGDYEFIYLALVRERCMKDGFNPETELVSQLRAHMNRGAVMVMNRMKSIDDLAILLPNPR